MMNLNLGVMLIIAGIFFITMILLKIWLFDPLIKFMDERDKTLKKELQIINQNSEETKAVEEEIKTVLQHAKDDAKKILDEGKMKAFEEAEKIKVLKRNEIEEAKESLKLILQKEKANILNELLKEKEGIKTLAEKKLRNVA